MSSPRSDDELSRASSHAEQMREPSERARLPAATRTAGRPTPGAVVRRPPPAVQDAADVAIGVTAVVLAGARSVLGAATRTSQEAFHAVRLPVPRAVRRQARSVWQTARAQGQAQRAIARAEIGRVADVVVPRTAEAVLSRTDVAGIVDQLDIDAIVDRLDLDAIVARVDMDAIIDRIDLMGLAHYIVDGIDLPAIIRSSSGSMTTEMVRGMRRGTADADEVVERIVDRLLLRRAPRRPASPNGRVGRRPDDHTP
jgi:hypothetical protein